MVSEIILRIKALFEGRGAADAEKAVDGLGRKSGEAAQSTGSLGGALGKTAGVMSQMNAALAQGGPEAQRMAGGLRLLGSVVKGLQGGLLGIGTVAAGFLVSAFMKWRNAIAENEKKIEEFRKKYLETEAALRQTRFQDSIDEHNRLRGSIDAVSDAYSRMSAAQAAADNAEKGARTADLNLREKEAMGALGPGDSLGKAKLTAQFAEERRALELEYSLKDARRAADERANAHETALARQGATEAEAAETARQRDSAARKKAQLVRQYTALQDAPTPTRQRTVELPYGGTQTITETDKAGVARRKKEMEEIRSQLEGDNGLNAVIKRLDEAAQKLNEKLERERTEAQARGIEHSAARKSLETVATYTPAINRADGAAERRDIQKTEDAALRERIRTLEQELASVNEGFFRSVEQMYQNAVRAGEMNIKKMDDLIRYTRDLGERNRMVR